MLESAIKSKVIHAAKMAGMVYARMTGPKGTPDHIFLYKSAYLIVEFKQENGKLSPMQLFQIAEYKKCGVTVHVPNNLAEAKALLIDFKEKHN